jgi:thiosulfate/3-mercaptopyruvate sulfurtransferase
MQRLQNRLPLIDRRCLLRMSAAAGATLMLWHRAGIATAVQQTHPADSAEADPLVDTAWLRERLGSDDLVLVGFMPPDEFAAGHIPGSVQIDWPELELADTSDASVASWETSVAAIVGGLGITLETDVLVYDNGTLFAARLWWVLHYLGHQRLHLLNGGLPAWVEAGGDVAEGESSPTPADPYTGSSDPDALAQLDEVLDDLDRDDVVFVDARTEAVFAEGHIPGAVNINYPLNASQASPAKWLPQDDLLSLYESHGVTPDKLVIPYCTSGVRSAVTAFT